MAASCESKLPPPLLKRERERKIYIFPYLCCFHMDVFSWLKMGISERIFFNFGREKICTMQDLLGALCLASFSYAIFVVRYVAKICRIVSFTTFSCSAYPLCCLNDDIFSQQPSHFPYFHSFHLYRSPGRLSFSASSLSSETLCATQTHNRLKVSVSVFFRWTRDLMFTYCWFLFIKHDCSNWKSFYKNIPRHYYNVVERSLARDWEKTER